MYRKHEWLEYEICRHDHHLNLIRVSLNKGGPDVEGFSSSGSCDMRVVELRIAIV